MSANPNQASAGLDHLAPNSSSTTSQPEPSPAAPSNLPVSSSSNREALQALLAFSSLQEQIRQRKAREARNGRTLSPDDVWELEQFMLDEVLHLVAERAMAITDADGIAIALAEGNAIICRASVGDIAPDPGAKLNPQSGFSGACFRSGQIIRCDDSETDPRVDVLACRRLATRSMVAVPLLGQQSVIGVIEAFSHDAYAFNDSDVRSLNLLSELILAAMRPEEEDRMAEISRQVSASSAPAVEPSIPADVQKEVAKTARPEVVEPKPTEGRDASAEVPDSRPALDDLVPIAVATSVSSPVDDLLPAELIHNQSSLEEPEAARPGLWVVLLLATIALGLGGFVWWKIQHRPPAPTVTQNKITAPALTENSVPPASTESTNTPLPGSHADLPMVTGIRHWSSPDTSTVVVDLQDQVNYEAHRLSDPERIYFDLPETSLSSSWSGRTVEIRDDLLLRVRIAQPTEGTTRIVLETKGPADYSVSLEQDPYRLVVEVRKTGTKPQAKAKVDLFAPLSPAATEQAPAMLLKQVPETQLHASKFSIVLDAGHGGWDLGTVGRKGLLEKDLVLDIVGRLGSLVEKRLGGHVIYTRRDDTYIPLEKRTEIANLEQADMFLSVHANYSDSATARGVETYYTNTYSSVRARTSEANTSVPLQNINWTNVDLRGKVLESRKFAASVQQELFSRLVARNPGLRNRGVKEASYVVLTGTTMPAVLAEVSFVSSPTDETALQSAAYRQQIAEALYKGIARYVEVSHHEKIATASGRTAGQ